MNSTETLAAVVAVLIMFAGIITGNTIFHIVAGFICFFLIVGVGRLVNRQRKDSDD